MKRLIQLVIIYGLIYGLLFVVLLSLFSGGEYKIKSWFLAGMFAGWGILIYFSLLYFFELKKINIENLFKISQKRIFCLNLNKAEALDKAEQALLNLSLVIKKMDVNTGIIFARTKISWGGDLGQNLVIGITSKKDKNVEVEVESKSILITALNDGGKNLKNVEEFYKLMNK